MLCGVWLLRCPPAALGEGWRESSGLLGKTCPWRGRRWEGPGASSVARCRTVRKHGWGEKGDRERRPGVCAIVQMRGRAGQGVGLREIDGGWGHGTCTSWVRVWWRYPEGLASAGAPTGPGSAPLTWWVGHFGRRLPDPLGQGTGTAQGSGYLWGHTFTRLWPSLAFPSSWSGQWPLPGEKPRDL